jgi:hypothetical protein
MKAMPPSRTTATPSARITIVVVFELLAVSADAVAAVVVRADSGVAGTVVLAGALGVACEAPGLLGALWVEWAGECAGALVVGAVVGVVGAVVGVVGAFVAGVLLVGAGVLVLGAVPVEIPGGGAKAVAPACAGSASASATTTHGNVRPACTDLRVCGCLVGESRAD